jgi:hypothetical protein
MTILFTVLLLLAFALLLILGIFSVLRELIERNVYAGPVLQDPGPTFHSQSPDQRELRSQFAWQSRSHFRAPD